MVVVMVVKVLELRWCWVTILGRLMSVVTLKKAIDRRNRVGIHTKEKEKPRKVARMIKK